MTSESIVDSRVGRVVPRGGRDPDPLSQWLPCGMTGDAVGGPCCEPDLLDALSMVWVKCTTSAECLESIRIAASSVMDTVHGKSHKVFSSQRYKYLKLSTEKVKRLV